MAHVVVAMVGYFKGLCGECFRWTPHPVIAVMGMHEDPNTILCIPNPAQNPSRISRILIIPKPQNPSIILIIPYSHYYRVGGSPEGMRLWCSPGLGSKAKSLGCGEGRQGFGFREFWVYGLWSRVSGSGHRA